MSAASHTVVIRGTGSYAPARVLTNHDLSKSIDTSDEWIVSRTGIRERHISGRHEDPSDMAARAAQAALAAAGMTPADVDAIIVATMTGDLPFPSTACLVQHKIGAPKCTAFDIAAACSGFIYGLEVASSLIRAGVHRTVLLIGAEKLSSILNWTDRTTCVLFGDGAGAVVLSREPGTKGSIIGIRTGADGEDAGLLYQHAGGSRHPATADSIAHGQHFLRMNGREVFKHAVLVMEKASTDLLKEHGFAATDVDCVIPHQANRRIIETMAERLEVPLDRFFINLDRYGNTSAASIPIALDEAARAGRLRPGALVLLVAFGAGLTWGAALLRWPAPRA